MDGRQVTGKVSAVLTRVIVEDPTRPQS